MLAVTFIHVCRHRTAAQTVTAQTVTPQTVMTQTVTPQIVMTQTVTPQEVTSHTVTSQTHHMCLCEEDQQLTMCLNSAVKKHP